MPLVLDRMPTLAGPHSLMLNWLRKPSFYGEPDWTVAELARQTGWSPQIVEERVLELADRYLVEESRMRICRVDRLNAQAWRATS